MFSRPPPKKEELDRNRAHRLWDVHTRITAYTTMSNKVEEGMEEEREQEGEEVERVRQRNEDVRRGKD